MIKLSIVLLNAACVVGFGLAASPATHGSPGPLGMYLIVGIFSGIGSAVVGNLLQKWVRS